MTSLRLASVPACPGGFYVYLRGEGDRMHVWLLITLTALPTPLLRLLRHPVTHRLHHIVQVTSYTILQVTGLLTWLVVEINNQDDNVACIHHSELRGVGLCFVYRAHRCEELHHPWPSWG